MRCRGARRGPRASGFGKKVGASEPSIDPRFSSNEVPDRTRKNTNRRATSHDTRDVADSRDRVRSGRSSDRLRSDISFVCVFRGWRMGGSLKNVKTWLFYKRGTAHLVSSSKRVSGGATRRVQRTQCVYSTTAHDERSDREKTGFLEFSTLAVTAPRSSPPPRPSPRRWRRAPRTRPERSRRTP